MSADEKIVLLARDIHGHFFEVEMTPEELQAFCRQNLLSAKAPNWKDDPSYFWRRRC